MTLHPSAHTDTFARDHLPPRPLWPKLEFTLPELQYPDRLNAATALLDDTIARYGADRIAISTPPEQNWGSPEEDDSAWTYAELRDRVNQVANLLTDEHGLVPGNRVLLRSPNTPWTVIMWLAVLKAGGIAVTTMVAWRKTELRQVIRRTIPKLIVADHRFAAELVGELTNDQTLLLLGGPQDDIIAESARRSDRFQAIDTAADDVALLGATSGTTGEPKITAHFHRDVLAIADTFAKHVLRMEPDDVVAGSPPLAFTFGLGGLAVFPLRFGASSYLLERASPAALADAIEQRGVTVLFTAPTGYRTMLKEDRASALSRLRIAVSAGEHLPLGTFEAVEKASGVRLIDGIGATEMLHVFISAAGDDIRPGATGKAVPGYRAAVLGEDGTELPPGQLGRLAVIGPTGCRYLDDERQQRYVQHGWNITGDTYRMDEDGYFYYAARSDDMIVASGYNVGAPEVENAIDSHPSVIESAVVARPDPQKGAVVNAFVVLADGVPADDTTRDSIRETVREQLATYKIPRRIDFLDELPRNPSGKLLRFPLRQRAEHEAAQELRASTDRKE